MPPVTFGKIDRHHRQHQREDEGRDGEIEAADAKRRGADDRAREPGRDENGRQQEEDVHVVFRRDERRQIGADREEAALPERVEPEHSGHQIEADGEDAEDGGDKHQALHGQSSTRATKSVSAR